MILKTAIFTAEYKQGAIRYIKAGKVEIIRMIYSAIRDSNWGTLTPKILKEKINQTEDGFVIKLFVEYQKKNIHFEANYQISGKGGQLIFEMEGKACSSFQTNRIGLCVLHPIKGCEGKRCMVVHTDSSCEVKRFPELISPHQPIMDITELMWKPASSINAKLSFFGDIFEMEDQRNWTDASYKTYSRPLKLPFPYSVRNGEKIQQKIILEVQDFSRKNSREDIITFSIDESRRFKIPEIGTCSTSRKEPIEPSEAELLRQLPLKHIRGEIKLFEKDWELMLERIGKESKLLNLPLFLVLYVSDNYKDEVHKFLNIIGRFEFKIHHILLVNKNHLFDNTAFENTLSEFKKLISMIKMGSGVNAYFAELNRNQTHNPKADFVNFTVCPQVHAFDNATLIENIEGQKYVIESAKALFSKSPVFISPVTLEQRFNVVATSNEPETESDKVPTQVDIRQNSLFVAQWLLGSLKTITQAKADLVTYFESVGWRGIIQGNHNPPVPDQFSAKKDDIFPTFHLLKEIAGYKKVIYSESNLPLEVDGIVLSCNYDENKIEKIILSNYTGETKSVRIKSKQKLKKVYRLNEGKTYKVEKNKILFPAFSINVIE